MKLEWNNTLWKTHVEKFACFIDPLAEGIGRSERREGARLYVRGLLSEGQRKSIEPMAQRLGVDKQKLQQFVSDSPWDEQVIWKAIRQKVIPTLEPTDAWIVDETGCPKQGEKSVGVWHQYCGALGKQANCQVSVELVASDGQTAFPLAARLYLPEAWANDLARRQEAGVPDEVVFQTKPMLAMELIRQTLADAVPPAPVLGDEVYGNSHEFRRQLREARLEYFLTIGADQHAWLEKPELSGGQKKWKVAAGQPPGTPLGTLASALRGPDWKTQTWRAADGTSRRTRIAWKPMWLHSDLDEQTGAWPESMLVVDWPEGKQEPFHVYTAVLASQPNPKRYLRWSRGRFPIEHFYQRGKTDLGLDHYEGRSWQGYHHHLVLSMVAYLFVSSVYLSVKKNFWCDVGADPAADEAVDPAPLRALPPLRLDPAGNRA
jgi:SRSO17 transposase